MGETDYRGENAEQNPALETEYRGGVEWRVAYEDEGGVRLPVYGMVPDAEGRPLIEARLDRATGGVSLDVAGAGREWFETFDEAADYAYDLIQMSPAREFDRYPVHDLTGREGVYLLGEAGGAGGSDGALVAANAFWSESEPGYVNFGVFEVSGGGRFDILDGGLYNGYLSIEDCVRDLALQFAPGAERDVRFVADCCYEIGDIKELRGVLEEAEPLDAIRREAKDRAAAKNAERPELDADRTPDRDKGLPER